MLLVAAGYKKLVSHGRKRADYNCVGSFPPKDSLHFADACVTTVGAQQQVINPLATRRFI